MSTRIAIDQLCVDAYSGASVTKAAIDDVACSKLLPSCSHIDRLAGVVRSRAERNDAKIGKTRQAGNDLLDQRRGAISQVSIGVAQLQWQHGNPEAILGARACRVLHSPPA